MAFSDFPDPRRLCYSSAEEYLRYLQCYTHHFDLERHIRYHSEIYSAVLGEDKRWYLKIRQLKEQQAFSIQADAIIVATGANQMPNKTPSGLTEFTGQVIHSSEYGDEFKRHVAENDLRVLVVGAGESGADISAELGELSSNVMVWMRRPNCIGPRYLNDKNEMQQVTANKGQDFPANGFLEAVTTSRLSAGLSVYAFGFFRRILFHAPVLNRTLNRMDLDSTASAFITNDQATYVTKNQRMCEAIQEKTIKVMVCPTVLAHERTCEFLMPNGTRQQYDFDVVVLCTGFRMEFPWLRLNGLVSNPRAWFLHCFPEGLGHCLFFVGYARPHQGGIPVMAEMLSRYIALLLSGERTLPVDYASQARRDAKSEREYYFVSPSLHTLVDYNAFLESVARRVGCEPRLPLFCILFFNIHMLSVMLLLLECFPLSLNPLNLVSTLLLWAITAAGFFLFDNGLLFKWFFYPNWAIWYRQRGPGATPTLPAAVLRRVDVWKATSITRGFVLVVLWYVPTFYAQRLLSLFMFAPHVILTAFGLRFPKAWGGLLVPKLFALHGTQWRVSDLFMP
jgi:dimethylaniline monooxygenase (N-oxide forming)